MSAAWEPHVRFEYDPEFEGCDYSGTGRFVQVPLSKVEELGAEAAFTAATGYPDRCLIHHSTDELYDAEGNRLPDEADEMSGPGL